MILSVLQSALKDKVTATKIYDTFPLEPALPYIFLKTKRNQHWGNLLKKGIKLQITCEYHTSNKKMDSLLSTVRNIKDVLTSDNLLRKNPKIIYIHFTHYEIKEYKIELLAGINFETVTLY